MSLALEVAMSLSKYYKDSSSFKPQEIVKQDENLETGWRAEGGQPPGTFKARNLSDVADTASDDQQLSDEPNTAMTGDDSSEPSHQDGENNLPEADQADTSSLDLSQYILLQESEVLVDKAYQKGIEDGLAKVDDDYVTAARTLTVICQQLDQIRNTIMNNSAQELQELALSIAERILRISLAEQDMTIIATIEEALMRAVKSDEFTIYIHPDDFVTVAEKSERLIAEISGLSNIILKKDRTVERGGARIESENCTIAATIVSQFETIRDMVRNKG